MSSLHVAQPAPIRRVARSGIPAARVLDATGRARVEHAVEQQGPIARQDDRAFDDVLQFTNVARPRILHETLHDRRRNVIDHLADGPALLVGEVRHEKWNVFPSLSQRRHVHRKHVKPLGPFFVYFAPGATHAPHHVPKAWADKYKGKFDQGWDTLREETIARQKQLGVVPKDCQLTAPNKELPAWDTVPDAMKSVLCRQMEVYAGFMEYADHHVGRMLEGLKKLDVFDDTLVYYIIGDNGASAEGGVNGCFNEMSYFNQIQAFETPQYLTEHLDKLGGPESYNHFSAAWALAMNTPYQWTKPGCLALGRHPQRHDRVLAQGHPGQGRVAFAVQPRD